MSRFWTKLHICLAEPRKLGFFMGEKKWKSLLQLLLVLIVALVPYLIRISVNDEISSSSKTYIETILMTEQIDSQIAIVDGKLVGDESISIAIEEGVIFINPLDQKLENDDYKYLPVFELREEGVRISLSNKVIKELTYFELGYLNIDFNKIFKSNYIEFNILVSLVNDVYNQSKAYMNAINFVSTVVINYVTLIFTASIIALFGGVINKLVAYKFRFKGALDAQFISIIFILLANLFNIAYIELIGIFFSIFYFMRGLMAIVRIEIRKINKEGQ